MFRKFATILFIFRKYAYTVYYFWFLYKRIYIFNNTMEKTNLFFSAISVCWWNISFIHRHNWRVTSPLPSWWDWERIWLQSQTRRTGTWASGSRCRRRGGSPPAGRRTPRSWTPPARRAAARACGTACGLRHRGTLSKSLQIFQKTFPQQTILSFLKPPPHIVYFGSW